MYDLLFARRLRDRVPRVALNVNGGIGKLYRWSFRGRAFDTSARVSKNKTIRSDDDDAVGSARRDTTRLSYRNASAFF